MRLLFVRHGESVDNAAGLLAGRRDATLTAHGALQARRLALSLAAEPRALTHVFASDLQRAARTAQAVCDAQNAAARRPSAPLAVVLLPELREKDFGRLEGLTYSAAHEARAGSATEPGGGMPETALSMRARATRFLDEHIVPLLREEDESGAESVGAVVAHGIFLSVLVKALMDKVPRDQVVLPTEADLRNGLVMDASGPVLPSWSNTGFLELSLSRPAAVSRAPAAGDHRWPLLMRVERVNSTCHLRNLSRTRGGIGSAPYDDRQRTLTHFFAPAPKDSRGRR